MAHPFDYLESKEGGKPPFLEMQSEILTIYEINTVVT